MYSSQGPQTKAELGLAKGYFVSCRISQESAHRLYAIISKMLLFSNFTEKHVRCVGWIFQHRRHSSVQGHDRSV